MIPPGFERSTGIPPIYLKNAPNPYRKTVCFPINVILASKPATAATPKIPSQFEVCGATIATNRLFLYFSLIEPQTCQSKIVKIVSPNHCKNFGRFAQKHSGICSLLTLFFIFNIASKPINSNAQ